MKHCRSVLCWVLVGIKGTEMEFKESVLQEKKAEDSVSPAGSTVPNTPYPNTHQHCSIIPEDKKKLAQGH